MLLLLASCWKLAEENESRYFGCRGISATLVPPIAQLSINSRLLLAMAHQKRRLLKLSETSGQRPFKNI
jgi:hypothetical protein